MDDFINKRSSGEYCKAFKYRNIPSGKSELKLHLEMNLLEINSRGLYFYSNYMIKKDTLIKVKIDHLVKGLTEVITVRITFVEFSENGQFYIHSQFEDLDEKSKASVMNFLKS